MGGKVATPEAKKAMPSPATGRSGSKSRGAPSGAGGAKGLRPNRAEAKIPPRAPVKARRRVAVRLSSPERRVAAMFSRWYRGLVAYFRETKVEMRKVVWPSRQEALIYTLVVVVATAAVGLVVWIFDVGLSALLGKIIR